MFEFLMVDYVCLLILFLILINLSLTPRYTHRQMCCTHYSALWEASRIDRAFATFFVMHEGN